jgi:VIT1/CCC1 family predicted Fe2+/Mn2+ transporter
MPERDLRRYRANLQAEADGAAIYDALADSETDPAVARVYRRLAAVERAHAEVWTQRIIDGGGGTARPKPSLRAIGLGWLARRFGPAVVLPTILAAEKGDSSAYAGQPEPEARKMLADEREHARLIAAAADPAGGLSGPALLRLEGRHRGGGGNVLRASVLGANDGLVSNLSLVMGVAGAAASPRTILLTGFAGLVAGACSMAMGEWLSVNSARELSRRQIETEAEELSADPEAEKAELVLIYQAKGLDEATARSLADKLFARPDGALDTLAREELGIDPHELGGSAWAAASYSFLLFALGAVIPIIPYLVLTGPAALWASVVLSGAALAFVGAGTALFTGRGVIFSASRQLLIGFLAAAVTFAAGRLAGVALG